MRVASRILLAAYVDALLQAHEAECIYLPYFSIPTHPLSLAVSYSDFNM